MYSVVILSRDATNLERCVTAALEAEHLRPERRALEQHRLRVVDPHRLLRLQLFVQRARQLARPAAEIDHPHSRPLLDERGQVAERLRALRLEFLVLVRGPRAHRKWSQFMIAFMTNAYEPCVFCRHIGLLAKRMT